MKSSLNTHEGGCGPFTPGRCCTRASEIKDADPAVFASLSESFARKKKRRRMAERHSASKTTKRVRKAPRGGRGVRADSHVSRLKLPARTQQLLQAAGHTTVGDLVKHSLTEIASLVGRKPAGEVAAKLKSFGKQLAG